VLPATDEGALWDSIAMVSRILEADYLVVGSGAAGMAFADSLIDVSDAQVVIVDRRHAPGGHWNEAYPFVRLHTPSSFYGGRHVTYAVASALPIRLHLTANDQELPLPRTGRLL
jgi:choline dehydrogenase-like flavoprotein